MGRLWTTHCIDYPDDSLLKRPQCLSTRTLNADGTISDWKGEYGFTGVGQRAIYGGVQAIPQWFRDKYGVTHPYAVGWGGYTSRMAQGLVPSLGLEMLAIPDVASYKADSVIPAKDFKILADHRSGTTNGLDWYAMRKPAKFDRGQRNADVVNYYDGGDKRQNPSSPPGDPPLAGAQWQSPAPDGFGRFVWGDSFYNTGCWIDGPNKGGFIVIGSFANGQGVLCDIHPEQQRPACRTANLRPQRLRQGAPGKEEPVERSAGGLEDADARPHPAGPAVSVRRQRRSGWGRGRASTRRRSFSICGAPGSMGNTDAASWCIR